MNYPEPTICINVDVTNPGQFFACCGLMELADRLWPGVEGWFSNDDKSFNISGTKSLIELIESIADAELLMIRPDDPYSTPLIIGKPFIPLSIDWWDTEITGARDLKVWAGTMESYGIASAMQRSLKD